MKNLIETLSKKEEKHLNLAMKLDEEGILKKLKLELKGAVNEEDQVRAGEKLLITIQAIEYHNGCAKAYRKSRQMLEEFAK